MEHGSRSQDAPAKPRLDARTTGWLLAQRERVRELELESARMRGALETSERIERAAQRYADRLEERLEAGRKREASLARAIGYLEAERDQLAAHLGAGAAVPQLEVPPPVRRAEVRPGEARPARGRAGRA